MASGADAEPTNDHAQEAPAENTAAKQNEDKGDGKDKKDEAAKSGNKDKDSDKKAEASSWTEEEDQELIKLKEEGSTWAQITEKLGRPKKDLTQRFGELKRAGSKTGKPAAGQESQRDKQEAKSTQPSSAPKDSDGSGCWESDAEIDPVGSLRQKSQPFEEDSEVKATFESIGSLSMEEVRPHTGYHQEGARGLTSHRPSCSPNFRTSTRLRNG